jgi:2-haloacid dehalogenase
VEFEVIAFDVFGTLVDWRSSVSAELARIGERAGLQADWPAVADAWRSRYHPALGRVLAGELPYQSLDELHAMMLDEVIEAHRLQALTPVDRAELVRGWYRLAPWPDVVPGLSALAERFLLTPLSNGGVGLLTRLAKTAGLPFDCILSAELAGSYKPDPKVYRLVSRYLDVPPERVLMVACHPADLEGAHRAGLRTGYLPRPHEWGPAGSAPPAPSIADVVAEDLVALAARLASVR